MWNILAGLAIAVYSAFTLVTAGELNQDLIVRFGGGVAAGLGFALYHSKDYLSVLAGKVKNPFAKKTVTVSESDDQVFVPTTVEQKDFACLIHLKNRVEAAKSSEGIETVQKLNQIIFSLNGQPKNA